jgi:hypothetical protein
MLNKQLITTDPRLKNGDLFFRPVNQVIRNHEKVATEIESAEINSKSKKVKDGNCGK